MGCEALAHEIEPVVAEEHFIVDKEGRYAEHASLRGGLVAPIELGAQLRESARCQKNGASIPCFFRNVSRPSAVTMSCGLPQSAANMAAL